ncbi:MAG: MFS transporter [Acetobacteraceae bacterium]
MTNPRDLPQKRVRQSGPAAPPAGNTSIRPVVIFGVVAMALLMSSLDQTIVATALHALQHDLGAPITWASWTMTIYSLGLVIMLPIAGKLSEQYGRRRVFLASVGIFTAASLCCGLAWNIYVLVTLRFLQALGGAGFTPSATAIIVDHFGSARDRAVGLFGSIFPIGAMIGPIFGGLFVTYWSWRGIFLVNVPIGALLIVLCVRFIPRDPLQARRPMEHFDLAGTSQLGVGVLAVMAALNALSDGDRALWTPEFLAPSAIAVLALALFARHTATSSRPLIPGRFITGRGFGATNVINIVYGGMVAGLVALIPLYATTRFGIPALGSGTLLTAQGAAVVVMSSIGAFFLRKTGYRLPIYVGAVVMAIGIFALSVIPPGVTAYAWLAFAAGVIGLGAGWASPASRNAGLQLAPESSSTLAALRSMCRQIGLITTISITTAMISGAVGSGAAHAHAYAIWAVILLLLIPVIARVPEHRGAW